MKRLLAPRSSPQPRSPSRRAAPTTATTRRPSAAAVADSTPTTSSASSAATSTPTVDLVQIEDFGVVLADADGRVLYAADEEADPDVVCTDACEEFWQPLDVGSAEPTGAPGVTELGVADRPDGTKQVTFDGRRLYTFTLDAAGEATGEGFSDTFGGQRFTWHVVVDERPRRRVRPIRPRRRFPPTAPRRPLAPAPRPGRPPPPSRRRHLRRRILMVEPTSPRRRRLALVLCAPEETRCGSSKGHTSVFLA